jgi:ATP-dependent DNA helicase RecG
MQLYSDDEFLGLIRAGESMHCEFKVDLSSKDNKEKICRTISAFANDISNQQRNGIIVLGIKDDGSLSGLSISEKLERDILDIKGEGKIIPQPTFVCRKQIYKDQEVLRIEVVPAVSPPVKYEGKIWVRPGNTTRQATIEDERQLYTEARRPANMQPDDCLVLDHRNIEDLDLKYFVNEYLPSAIHREVLQANGRTVQEQLCGTKMAGSYPDVKPTVLGILCLGWSPTDSVPGAYVQFVRFAGRDETSSVLDQQEIHGRIASVIQEAEAKFNAHNLVPIDYTSQDKEVQFPLYPKVAFQQLFRNAVMHRAYVGSNSPIRFYWFEDRIEITNPGGPFGMTIQEFGQPYKTGYRNPNLAGALKDLDYVQKFGSGLKLAQAALQANGNPDLKLDPSQNFVSITMLQKIAHA